MGTEAAGPQSYGRGGRRATGLRRRWHRGTVAPWHRGTGLRIQRLPGHRATGAEAAGPQSCERGGRRATGLRTRRLLGTGLRIQRRPGHRATGVEAAMAPGCEHGGAMAPGREHGGAMPQSHEHGGRHGAGQGYGYGGARGVRLWIRAGRGAWCRAVGSPRGALSPPGRSAAQRLAAPRSASHRPAPTGDRAGDRLSPGSRYGFQPGSRPLSPTARSSSGASSGTGTTGPKMPPPRVGSCVAARRKPYDVWSAAGSGS